jgi:hypothetical protein
MTKKNNQDLSIEEKKEFIDIMDEHIGSGEVKVKPLKKDKIEYSGLELLGFLENENLRLKKITDLAVNKLPNKMLYPQTDRLIEKQLESNLAQREELIFKISEHSSDLNINLKEIWNRHFKDA